MSISTIIYNKKLVPSNHPCISHNDRGFTLGHGLFETILVKQSVLPALNYHWQRLESSAHSLGIVLPFNCFELELMIKELIIANNLQDKRAGVRVTISHGESERGILPLNTPSPNFLILVFECPLSNDKPCTALIANTRKNEYSLSSRIKSLSYLDNILARQESRHQGYDEAILLNTASNVADGSVANVYMVKNGQIFTPPLCDGALPGVIRNILIEGLPLIEKSISLDELLMADEAFFTNALMGIKSINQINQTKFFSFEIFHKIKSYLQNNNFM